MGIGRFGFLATVYPVIVLANGCSWSDNPAYTESYVPQSVSEIGPTLISVDNAVPWEEIAGALEPNFAVNGGDDFLNNGLPTTALIQTQVLKALGIRAAVGLPRSLSETVEKAATESARESSIDSSGTSASTTTATTTGSSNKTTTRGPGELPALPVGSPTEGTLPTPIDIDAALTTDPFLKYQAAASLFQAVRLLNAEVRNAALRDGYLPYLVRLKLAPIPYRDDINVNIYAKIAFFHAHNAMPSESQHSLAEREQNGTPTQKFLPYVLPLLITDNIERAVEARAAELARQFGLAVNFMINNVGGNVAANDQMRRAQSFTASDFNSLRTVTRLSDNTLFVRLGAMNQAPTGRAIQARTYDIALLLLVPAEYWPDIPPEGKGVYRPTLSVITQVEMRDSEGKLVGAGLDNASVDEAFHRKAEAAMERFFDRAAPEGTLENWNKLTDSDRYKLERDLRNYIQQSDFDKFFKLTWDLMVELVPNDAKPNIGRFETFIKSLWVLLNQPDSGTGLRSASVELRRIKLPTVEEQLVLLRDNGSTTEATLRVASNFVSGRIAAFLDVVPKGAARTNAVSVPAVSMIATEALKTVHFEFPSLSAIGLSEFEVGESSLRLRATECVRPMACDFGTRTVFNMKGEARPLKVAYQQVSPLKRTLGAQIWTSTQNVVATNGQGTITLFLDEIKDEEIGIRVAGAELISIDQPIGAKKMFNGFVVNKNSEIRLKIGQLKAGQKFKIKLIGKRSGAITGETEVEFDVI